MELVAALTEVGVAGNGVDDDGKNGGDDGYEPKVEIDPKRIVAVGHGDGPYGLELRTVGPYTPW